MATLDWTEVIKPNMMEKLLEVKARFRKLFEVEEFVQSTRRWYWQEQSEGRRRSVRLPNDFLIFENRFEESERFFYKEWCFMIIRLTDEEYELYQKLRKATDEKEKEAIRKRLKEIAIQRDKALKDCPFAH